MSRTIKRYGSRKLYDTGASEYVSLERVAALIREGEDVRIIDNKSGDDVTSAVLAQIIAEEGRNGSGLSSGFLHDLVRMGERVIRRGEETVGGVVAGAKKNVGDMVGDARRRVRDVAPLADVRDEMSRLRERLDALETSLDEREAPDDSPEPPANAG
jgi:polyhydroxyalkanoate synthesis repressor PhaR